VVEHLPNYCEALSSSPKTAKRKQNETTDKILQDSLFRNLMMPNLVVF
jgi:hypothetical protein